MAKAQEKIEDTGGNKEDFVDELKPGTKLMHGQYTIENFLNAGGFGITYLAKDSLDRKIVIKECFPGAFCRRSRYVVQARSRAHQNELKSIVRLFVQEARSLAKLDHPNIVGVHQVFEDNDTAYMALDFVEGRDMLDMIEDPNASMTPAQIKTILKEVLGAVAFIHKQGILHRDISPDNILVNEQYHPVLIDFGAAREEATKQSRVLSALRVVKDGYSPQEFYIAGSQQNPSSDLYALAASFFHLIAGDVPPNSQARLAAIASSEADPYVPLIDRFPDYDNDFLKAIDKALAVLPKDRVQSAEEWLALMEGETGNVTALNIANAIAETDAPEEALTEIAGAAQETKSKKPMLLASVGIAALLAVGAVAVTMTGGEEAPAEEVASAVPAPAQPVEEQVATAPVAEEAPVAEVEGVVEAPEPAAPAAPVEEPSAAPVIVDEEPVIVADGGATAEPEPAPEPEPLPEPLDTPRPATEEPGDEATLPDVTDARPSVETETPDVALPATPNTVEEIGDGFEVAIQAVTPGNEVVDSIINWGWFVILPFDPASPDSNVIGNVGAVSPLWVRSGLEITSVNDNPVSSIAGISAALRDSVEIGDADQIEVSFGLLDPATGVESVESWTLPVVRYTELNNGLRFETRRNGAEWETGIVSLPESGAGDLEVGDVLNSLITTGETIADQENFVSMLDRELGDGQGQMMFAVERGGSMWVASMTYEDEAAQ